MLNSVGCHCEEAFCADEAIPYGRGRLLRRKKRASQ